MTLNAKRKRVHDKLAALPGVRSVRRPVTPGGEKRFDLYYVRTEPRSAHPLVIIPGGPGVASVQQYRGLRKRATADGLDVIMIEHRGVGMSRHDDEGADLPPQALSVDQVVDDVAAVLDDAGVDQAVVYGTSYGTYIAAGVGVRHPARVNAMILDSPLLSAGDIDAVRDAIRRLLWQGEDPETEQAAAKIRRLLDEGEFNAKSAQLASILYGFGGPPLLDRQLDLLLRHRTVLWRGIGLLGRMTMKKTPYRNEADLVGRIAFRELDYAGEPDGMPLDPSEAMLEMVKEMGDGAPEFESEPYDLVEQMPKFNWPTVVISGNRDLTTPPAVAQQIASLIPGAVLVSLATSGHSILDTKERAALDIVKAVYQGETDELPTRAGELDAMLGRPGLRLLVSAIAAAAAVESAIPDTLPGLRNGPATS